MYEAERFELFFGAASPAVCRVYARYDAPAGSGLRIAGTLRGPNCLHTATLPAVSRFVDLGPEGAPLAEAVLSEPSFWTPEMPHLYEAQLELQADGQTVLEVRRTFGIRPLGAAGSRLRLAGRNVVLRAVTVHELTAPMLADARAYDAALVVQSPSEAMCEAASEIGVLLIAELDRPDLAELRRLARWPAVGMVVLPKGAMLESDKVGNLLLVERQAEVKSENLASWAHAVIYDVTAGAMSDLHVLNTTGKDSSGTRVPVLVRRASSRGDDVESRRAECDALQRDLAPVGQFAGYIV